MQKSFLLFLFLILVLAYSVSSTHANPGILPSTDNAKAGTESKGPEAPTESMIIKKGLRVEFGVEPASEKRGGPGSILEGEYAQVRFRVTDESSGSPVSPLEPAVWISLIGGKEGDLSCRDRISRYIQGTLSFQADIDLNKYFILVMNHDRSISVIDPLLGVSGITQLYTMIFLKDRGEDWIYSPDGKRLFVTMPKADSVAVVDLESFKIVENVQAGTNPVRVALQPDGKYLWVGNDGKAGSESGVTVIDARNYRVAGRIPTGEGHHEIAFSDDSLFAFVTNSRQGTLSVIETQQLKKLKDLPAGKHPIAVQFSGLSRAAYVAAEGDGTITVVDGGRHEITRTIRTEPGLIALRFAPGGRWGFAANIKQNRVDVVDASTGSIAHSLKVGDQPHQFAFTSTYGYVRHLGTPDVTMIRLAQLGEKGQLETQRVALGNRSPGEYKQPSVADAISPTGEWTAVVAANPADSMVYYYMEGMVAPMGSYSTYGRVPRAVGVLDRSVREVEKGVYAAKILVPKAGTYNVAFVIDSPWVDHCFTFTAEPNPLIKAEKDKGGVRIEFLNRERSVIVGEPFKVNFSLTKSSDGEPVNGLRDVVVLAMRMPGNWQQRQLAKPVGDGRYEVSLVAYQPGTYIVSVGVPSLRLDMVDLPYLSFLATPPAKGE